ncbi:MAG: glycoside hydrolase family 3 N-terminal domain-containing protein, partial [Ruminococcus flavefaciens]
MDIKQLLSKLTIEEKASLLSGADFWHTKAVERLGIPQMMMSDGPHGLRKQRVDDEEAGVNQSIEAVCFPAACALACSFDRDLLFRLGQALGNECQAENVGVILGPGTNIKRSPLCGRNFEYFSEDPFLASNMAASHIRGVQSKKVGTSLKHFAANNQENRRMSVSAEIDERTLHEIYLSAFEYAVREAKPATIMCSY